MNLVTYYCSIQYFHIMGLSMYTKMYSCIYILGRRNWFHMGSLPWTGWIDCELTLKCPNVTPHHLQYSPATSRPAAHWEVIPGSGRLLGHVLAYPRACLQEGMTSVKCVNQNVIHTYIFLQAARNRPCPRSDVRCWMEVGLFYLSEHRSTCSKFYRDTHLWKCVLVMLRARVKFFTFTDRKIDTSLLLNLRVFDLFSGVHSTCSGTFMLFLRLL